MHDGPGQRRRRTTSAFICPRRPTGLTRPLRSATGNSSGMDHAMMAVLYLARGLHGHACEHCYFLLVLHLGDWQCSDDQASFGTRGRCVCMCLADGPRQLAQLIHSRLHRCARRVLAKQLALKCGTQPRKLLVLGVCYVHVGFLVCHASPRPTQSTGFAP